MKQEQINKIGIFLILLLFLGILGFLGFGKLQNFKLFKTSKNISKKLETKIVDIKFSTGTFFDVENNFKSSIYIDFSLDFFEDINTNDKKKFIENRIKAKEKLISLLEIDPKVKVGIDDIILYSKRAILNLSLKPNTKYKIKLKSAEIGNGKKIEKKEFIFKSPDNKFFGFKINRKVTLFQDTNQPKFTFYSFNAKDKKQAKLRICRVDNENYAKIEVFDSFPNIKMKKDFFKNGIDKIKAFECKTKIINLEQTQRSALTEEMNLIKQEFDFKQEIGNPARSGLYYVTFDDKKDREYNGRIQRPIFFGIIDSHITMKISKNGSAFFFVNDFSGKPLANQEIRIYLNNFKSQKKDYKYVNGKYIDKTIYYSPFEKNVLSKPIYLGKTNAKGILQVNLKGKINDAFERTLNAWDYSWNGDLNSLFVTSASKTHLTYVSSKHNGGITPWNFGYSIGSWWYGENSENQDKIILQRWGESKEILSHIFTDRKLYLPGEEVHLKAILRNASDLSIPRNKKINVIIRNSKGKEVLNKDLFTNSYGSISTNLKLNKNSPLGNYFVELKYNNKRIGNSFFSVELFKNPKFKTEVMLETEGLNGELVKINETKIEKKYYGEQKKYLGNFKIKAKIFSKYYSGPAVKNAEFTYKVYKQYYYDNSYWDNCYYGCYWEPEKILYTEGKGKLDENGTAFFEVPIKFESSYDDYKYIVEVTITDKAGDTISSSNSIIAKLPSEYKTWNPNSGIKFEAEKRFYKTGENIKIIGRLQNGKFSKYYNDKFLLIIKKKDYENKEVFDIRGKKVNKIIAHEKIEKILKVNTSNFKLKDDGSLEFDYKVQNPGEYVFEYGKAILNKKEIKKDGKLKIEKIDNNTQQKLIIDPQKRKYFTIIVYGDKNAKNPIVSDNKIGVLTEKISYHIGEKARILIRLPESNGKILLTKEKAGVVSSELIPVKSNIFFKEFVVDNSFAPNTYIGVVFIPKAVLGKVPEYKVGYTEIVVDKTDKKAFVEIKTDKKEYKPREKVSLDIFVKNKNNKPLSNTELTVMVVDDSLISLMGNVDLNSLEKFYKKLPFQIQTAITNIAMLRNYYFSRKGIVGGSGFGNFKGGDSAVSSRNIFKNTAYYNSSVITNKNGKAHIEFSLPDNLTNFRIMVVANSTKNFFGVGQTFIEVRKNIVIEDKTPLILRKGDISQIGAQIFNNTNKDIGLKIELDAPGIEVKDKIKKIVVSKNNSYFAKWKILVPSDKKEINYTIKALGDSIDNSDKLEGKIEIKQSPVLIQYKIKNLVIPEFDKKAGVAETAIKIPKNTDINKSKVEVIFSNNALVGVEKIVSSLAKYPYGCIEQTISSTFPNAVVLKFSNIFRDLIKNKDVAKENLIKGIDRLESMQLKSGGFSYWQGETAEASININAYVLSRMLDMRQVYYSHKLDKLINNSIKYLKNNFIKKLNLSDQIEIFYALNKAGKKVSLNIDTDNLSRYELIKYTYGLYYLDKNLFKEKIEKNISKIKKLFEEDSKYNYFSNKINEQSLFVQLLLDLNYNNIYIDKLVKKLYNKNWSSYYFSTKTKANAFMAFAKYLEKNSKNRVNRFGYSLGRHFNRQDIFWVGGKYGVLNKQEFKLSDLIISGEDKIDFRVANLSPGNLYATIILKQYPKDILKVKSYSNKINISRKIYEVLDEAMLDKCNNYWNYNYRKYSKEFIFACDNALKLVKDNIYKKGKLYLVKDYVDFENSGDKKNFVIEDYLPGTFRVLNSNFKTEQALLKQNQKNWSWGHIEYRPDVVMAHTKYIWRNSRELSYFIRPEFVGKYTFPPVTGYFMYNPEIRANSKFSIIEVK